MSAIKVAVINRSTVVPDKSLGPVVAALQKQVHQDFLPIWGADADLDVFHPEKVPAGSWVLAILDNSDQASALGYHDVTSGGLPLGKVFALADEQNGKTWTITASHELLEMLGDPDINLTALVEGNNGAGRLFAYEVCDPCEDDQFAYAIDGVQVADFVTPAWFETFRKKGPFDFQKQIEEPFSLLPGGYIGVYDIAAGTGWQQITKDLRKTDRSRPRVGSRRERRRTPRNRWIASTAV